MIEWLGTTLVKSPLQYALCTTPKAFAKEMKRLGITGSEFVAPPARANVTLFEEKTSSRRIAVVCIDVTNKLSRRKAHTSLAHEAVHVWQEVKRIIGEPDPSKEFEAYAIQSIANNLIKSYDKAVKQAKK